MRSLLGWGIGYLDYAGHYGTLQHIRIISTA